MPINNSASRQPVDDFLSLATQFGLVEVECEYGFAVGGPATKENERYLLVIRKT